MSERLRGKWLDAALAVLIALSLLCLALLYHAPPSSAEEGVEELPGLFAKSVYYLALSKDMLANATQMLPIQRLFNEEDALAVAGRLRTLRQRLRGNSELESKLRASATSYEALARASTRLSQASRVLRDLMPRLEEALHMLAECRVDDALRIYRSCESDVDECIGVLGEALELLGAAEPRELLSEQHRAVYREALAEALRAYEMLREVKELFGNVDKHRSAYTKLCSAARGEATLTSREAEALRSDLASLNLKKLGCLSCEASRLASLIRMALSMQGPRGSQGTLGPSSGGGHGMGAGYREVEQDD